MDVNENLFYCTTDAKPLYGMYIDFNRNRTRKLTFYCTKSNSLSIQLTFTPPSNYAKETPQLKKKLHVEVYMGLLML